jgi:hypothetical protein
MRKALLLLLGAPVLALAACGSTEYVEPEPAVEEEVDTFPAPEPYVPLSTNGWSRFLVVMTNKERNDFLGIDGRPEREQWLRRNGIDVRADLAEKLSRGMTIDQARRGIAESPDEVLRDGDTTTMFFSRYNTLSFTHFWLKFEDGKLLSWNSYTREQQDRERELLDFQQRLMRKFNTVLERGMGMNAINRQAAAARDDLNRVQTAHRERTEDADYRAGRSVSARDYIIAEQLLYAQTRNELFEWFQGRIPDQIIHQRPFETHRYYLLHRDLRGNETLVTAEFVFEGGALKDWFVYHER